MTIAILKQAEQIELPPVPAGISHRAVRNVLTTMARYVQDDGNFKHGYLKWQTIAELTGYSLSVIRRAQRFLVERAGILEKIEVGGGRLRTRWRVLVDKLGWRRHGRAVEETRPGGHPDTGQSRQSDLVEDLGRTARPFRLEPQRPTPADRRIVDDATCEHGGLVGLTRTGEPLCPKCRRQRWQRR